MNKNSSRLFAAMATLMLMGSLQSVFAAGEQTVGNTNASGSEANSSTVSTTRSDEVTTRTSQNETTRQGQSAAGPENVSDHRKALQKVRQRVDNISSLSGRRFMDFDRKVKKLLKNAASGDLQKILQEAASFGKREWVLPLLKKYGAGQDDKNILSSLRGAIKGKHKDLVCAILNQCPLVDWSESKVVLAAAVQSGDMDVIRALIDGLSGNTHQLYEHLVFQYMCDYYKSPDVGGDGRYRMYQLMAQFYRTILPKSCDIYSSSFLCNYDFSKMNQDSMGSLINLIRNDQKLNQEDRTALLEFLIKQCIVYGNLKAVRTLLWEQEFRGNNQIRDMALDFAKAAGQILIVGDLL